MYTYQLYWHWNLTVYKKVIFQNGCHPPSWILGVPQGCRQYTRWIMFLETLLYNKTQRTACQLTFPTFMKIWVSATGLFQTIQLFNSKVLRISDWKPMMWQSLYYLHESIDRDVINGTNEQNTNAHIYILSEFVDSYFYPNKTSCFKHRT